MTDRRSRKTREFKLDELPAGGEFPSDPPTQVTDLREMIAQLNTPDRWTVSVLTGASTGLVAPLEEQLTVIGRGSDCHIRLLDDGLSRRHAEIFRRGREIGVKDLGSTNGTYVNGQRISAATLLNDGDWVQLGSTSMRVSLQSEAELEAVQRLYESSVRDPLTGLYNRRHLDERLASEFAYSARHRTPLSLLMIDVDHFKRLNDTFGHPAGDEVLRRVSEFIQLSIRQEDVAGRYGGEEFCVLLRGIAAAGAEILAQRIRHGLEHLEVGWEGHTLTVTASIGVATHSAHHPYTHPGALLAAADECLYRAKNAGRNLVIQDASPRSIPPP